MHNATDPHAGPNLARTIERKTKLVRKLTNIAHNPKFMYVFVCSVPENTIKLDLFRPFKTIQTIK